MSGWPMLVVTIALYVATPALLFYAFGQRHRRVRLGSAVPDWWLLAGGWVVLAAGILLSPGFFAIQPNEARVLSSSAPITAPASRSAFAGATPSMPTDRPAAARRRAVLEEEGLRRRPGTGWANEVQALQGEPARAQPQRRHAQGERQARQPGRDRRGRRVARRGHRARPCSTSTTSRTYVRVQSESALRHLATRLPLRRRRGRADTGTRSRCAATSTRSPRRCASSSSVRLEQAGVTIEEAKLTHLAYAPEIAGAMLRRQQAEAVIGARRRSSSARSAWSRWR